MHLLQACRLSVLLVRATSHLRFPGSNPDGTLKITDFFPSLNLGNYYIFDEQDRTPDKFEIQQKYFAKEKYAFVFLRQYSYFNASKHEIIISKNDL